MRDEGKRKDQENKGRENEVGKCEGGKVAKQDTEAKRALRILFVGRIHPEKGLALLADALRLMASADKETKSRSPPRRT